MSKKPRPHSTLERTSTQSSGILPLWSLYKETEQTLLLHLYVKPNAAQNRVVGTYGTMLKIAVHAAPEDGKANKELIRFLSKASRLPASSFEIIHGHTCQEKRVCVYRVEDPFSLITQFINHS